MDAKGVTTQADFAAINGARQGYCVGAYFEGHGRLQRLRESDEPRRSQLPHAHGERWGRQGVIQRPPGVQERGQSGIALSSFAAPGVFSMQTAQLCWQLAVRSTGLCEVGLLQVQTSPGEHLSTL